MDTVRNKTIAPAELSEDLTRLLEARHHDPFSVLGKHVTGSTETIRVLLPGAAEVSLETPARPLQRIPGTDIFQEEFSPGEVEERYRIAWRREGEPWQCDYDPYCFPQQLSEFDLHLFGEGRHWHAYRFLGAHIREVEGIAGVLYSVWAPSAERVSVVCDRNRWDGRQNPMRVRGGTGVWEIFIPGMRAGDLYKFEIRNRDHGTVHIKIDPYAQRFEQRPATGCVVVSEQEYQWADDDWMQSRQTWDWQHQPLSIYEVHLGSWRRHANSNFLSYRELAHELVHHVKTLGFTHIELLPVTEHPLDASWGYQTTGYYAATSRFGSAAEFRYFVDYCHQNGIGVLLDWVPGHFPKDAHGLARFDGSALYEHSDPRRGEHRDWGTLIYNYGRNEVKNFLISSALFWLEEFHIDGLRVDAVASMLYLDYSRQHGDWLPNIYGGRENLEAIDFLRELNEITHGEHPGTLMIAEESTAWPQVTRPTWLGGLGFGIKWNMGWMHDTLVYLSKDPVFRHYHHDQLTFGLLYAFTENFLLPFSHDEVVHGKRSMLWKMPGDEWQKFANLRLLYTYMFTYPGKKLLFMGCEFGQPEEWDADRSLDWAVAQTGFHQGLQRIVSDLNAIYRELPALHELDFTGDGFEWIDCHDAAQSIVSYIRRSGNHVLVVALNFTPVPRHNYRVGVPVNSTYREVLNSDSEVYGGSNLGNGGGVVSESMPWMGRPFSLQLTLPPLAAVVLTPE